jgi:hypothetical protein
MSNSTFKKRGKTNMLKAYAMAIAVSTSAPIVDKPNDAVKVQEKKVEVKTVLVNKNEDIARTRKKVIYRVS